MPNFLQRNEPGLVHPIRSWTPGHFINPASFRDHTLTFPFPDVLESLIDACHDLTEADSLWAGYWCEKTDREIDGYWEAEGRPRQAMDDLAAELIGRFEGIDKEDQDNLSEELGRLLDACVFLINFRTGRWD